MVDFSNPLICAIDTDDLVEAQRWYTVLRDTIGCIKLGLEFFSAQGPGGIAVLRAAGAPIFLDLKLHDIPTTVAKAVYQLTRLRVRMLTLHASGGRTMMEQARQATQEAARHFQVPPPLLLGVTVLTSMDDQEIHQLGIGHTVADQVDNLAKLANQAGLDGIVCSAHEVPRIKQRYGRQFLTVVPGIRLEKGDTQDQKRTMTPKEAMAQGADYLVIGRPVTQAKDPAAVTKQILKSLL